MSYDESDYPWKVVPYRPHADTYFILERGCGTSFARFMDNGDPFPTRESAQRKADELNQKLASES